MYYDDESQATTFVAGLVLGAALGAGLALLLAPQSGRRTRRRLVHALEGARHTAEDRFDTIADDVRGAVDASRRKLKR